MAEFFCGIIEGFYGRTWPWPARRDLIRFLAEQRLDVYIYAPKADRQLRRAWRDSDDGEFEALLALREFCRAQSVRFGIGFSPWGLQSEYGAADRRALRDKFACLNRLDSDVLCILFDDMPGAIEGLAERQAAIVADICEFSSARRVLMCPTYYSFDPQLEKLFGAMPERYLETLGAMLPAEVDVLWTGALVVATGFTQADMTAVAARIGRKPVLWDNYPVNDGRKISRFLHLLPPPGRPWQLREWCAGHLANPMNQPYLSQLPLAALAQSYAMQSAFDAERFWRDDIERWVGGELAALLRRDVERFQRIGLDGIDQPQRNALIAEYGAIPHPAAREVADWLGEAYRFDPECLND